MIRDALFDELECYIQFRLRNQGNNIDISTSRVHLYGCFCEFLNKISYHRTFSDGSDKGKSSIEMYLNVGEEQ